MPRGDGDVVAMFHRRKHAYELLAADLDALIEAYDDEHSHVADLRELLASMRSRPIKRRYAAAKNTVKNRVASSAGDLLQVTGIDGDIAFVTSTNTYYRYSASARKWSPCSSTGL